MKNAALTGKKSREEILALIRAEDSPFATVSGIVTTNTDMIEAVDRRIPEIGLITTKSYQVRPNPGYPEPIVAESEAGCFINAVGLRNPGMEKGFADLENLQKRYGMRALLNISLSGNSPEEFILLVRKFEELADILELNFSCPHASGGYGMSIGTDPEIVYSYLNRIRPHTDALLFPKLTPNTDRIGEIAAAAAEGGADGIAAVNTAGPVLITEPVSGQPVLMNPKGNKGGKSGRWIHETALKKVREIREAVGPALPIIGMGGVTGGKEARAMKEAGADTIGIGSVFAALNPRDWEEFFSALKRDLQSASDGASGYVSTERTMEYRGLNVSGVQSHGRDMKTIELDGTMEFEAGQFAFLWLPGIGEKPFSIACGSPLTFVVRDRGRLSSALTELKAGDRLYIRGVYGAPAPVSNKKHIWIAAGGTGVAVALGLAEMFSKKGSAVHCYYGTEQPERRHPLKAEIEQYGDFRAVADEGVPGRAAMLMIEALRPELHDSAVYTIGPPGFMKLAAEMFIAEGGDPSSTFVSIETMTRCGVGLCGECTCGGKLTCREGTFFSMEFLAENSIEIMDFSHAH